MLAWNLGNYAFFVIAGRSVGPESYGTIAALLAATMLVQIPAGSVQVGISRRIAEIGPDDRPVSAWLVRRALPRSIGFGLLAAAMTFVITAFCAPDLPLLAVACTAAAVAPIPAFSLAIGALQGHKRFGGFSLSLSMLGAPRPFALLLFLVVMADVTAAMAASALTIALAAATATALAWPRRVPNPTARPTQQWDVFQRTIVPLAVGLSGIGVLINLDVIIARASLPERTAGLFGAVAVLAKAIIIIPQTAAWVLLPRVTEAEAGGRSSSKLLVLGVVISIFGGAVAATVALLFGRPIVTLVFGATYSDGGTYLAPLMATAALTGLLLVLMYHQLGRGIDGFVWVVAALAAVEAGIFALAHDSVAVILTAEAVIAIVGLAVYEILYGRTDGGISRSIRSVLHGATQKSKHASAT